MANPTTTVPTPEASSVERLVPVLVNRESMIQIPTSRKLDGTIVNEATVNLASGYNLVPEKLWVEAKKNLVVQKLMTTKIPRASAPEDNPEKVGEFYIIEGRPVDADNPLVKMSDADALEFISETFQVPVLQRLEKQESRATILRALRGQIDKIEKPKADAKAARDRERQ